MRRKILAATAAVLALTVAGCSDVVDGSGSEATGASQSGDFPTGSTDNPTSSTPTDLPTDDPTTSAPTTSAPTTTGNSPSPDFTCPDITYAGAYMTFNCLSNAMRVNTGGKVYTITMTQQVESTGWQMEMGAKLYDGSADSFPAISSDVRSDLLESGGYGTNPTYDLDTVNYSTISGLRAYTTVDTVTIDPTYAKSRKTAVKVEKRWLVIVELSPGRYTTWYASIPDIVKQYWAQVPAAIASIKINQ